MDANSRLLEIPIDTLVGICQQCDPMSLVNLMTTCKSLHDLVSTRCIKIAPIQVAIRNCYELPVTTDYYTPLIHYVNGTPHGWSDWIKESRGWKHWLRDYFAPTPKRRQRGYDHESVYTIKELTDGGLISYFIHKDRCDEINYFSRNCSGGGSSDCFYTGDQLPVCCFYSYLMDRDDGDSRYTRFYWQDDHLLVMSTIEGGVHVYHRGNVIFSCEKLLEDADPGKAGAVIRVRGARYKSSVKAIPTKIFYRILDCIVGPNTYNIGIDTLQWFVSLIPKV